MATKRHGDPWDFDIYIPVVGLVEELSREMPDTGRRLYLQDTLRSGGKFDERYISLTYPTADAFTIAYAVDKYVGVECEWCCEHTVEGMENSNPDFLQCHLHVPFIVHRPGTLAHAVSHILPDIAAKCPDTYAPWVLLGMKKDLRTNPKTVYNLKREGSNFVSMEEARNIGHKYGAEMVMECSSLREAQGSWILRKRLPIFWLVCLSVCLHMCVCMVAFVWLIVSLHDRSTEDCATSVRPCHWSWSHKVGQERSSHNETESARDRPIEKLFGTRKLCAFMIFSMTVQPYRVLYTNSVLFWINITMTLSMTV